MGDVKGTAVVSCSFSASQENRPKSLGARMTCPPFHDANWSKLHDIERYQASKNCIEYPTNTHNRISACLNAFAVRKCSLSVMRQCFCLFLYILKLSSCCLVISFHRQVLQALRSRQKTEMLSFYDKLRHHSAGITRLFQFLTPTKHTMLIPPHCLFSNGLLLYMLTGISWHDWGKCK